MKYLTNILIITCFIVPASVLSNDNTDLLVSVDVLVHKSRSNELVIIDVRSSEEYDSGHITNAVNIPVATLFSNGDRPDLVVSLNEAKYLFGNAGIDRHTDVVIYDSGNFIDAARAFWVLELYGHTRSALLDGGYPAWTDLNLPVSTISYNNKPKTYIPTVVPGRLSTKLSVRLAIDDHKTTIIDARPEQEYKGKNVKYSRAGHIPNAVNIPAMNNFSVSNGVALLRSDNELASLYSTIDKSNRIITYCNKGKDSALTYFVLRKMGFNASAYDGSWFEWSNDIGLPIDTDE